GARAPESYRRRAHLDSVRIADAPGSKRRPALVVSPDIRKRLASAVIVIPVSSVLREAPTHVRLRAREAGLDRPSVAKCDQITTLRRDRLAARPIGGHLGACTVGAFE